MEVKKGLRNPMDEAQVRKAVIALQSFVERQKADIPKKPLLENPEYLSCIITRKLIPSKAFIKPIQIDIPHSLRGGENDVEMCLFVKDADKERIKAALAADPVPGLAKVMGIKKLKKNFSRFEDKRTLAGAYDLFLADDRIITYLKQPLGTKFFVKKKQPVAVRVSRKDVSHAVRAVFHRTTMHINTGVCVNVKVAHLGMTADEAVENIMTAMNNCAAHIPKGWNGIQSISIKTNDSVALPVFNSLAPLAKLPPVGKKETTIKRKLEEEEPVEPKKKAKTNSGSAVNVSDKKAKKDKSGKKNKTEETLVEEEVVSEKKEKSSKKKGETKKDKTAKKEAKSSTPAKTEEVKAETTPKKTKKEKASSSTPVTESVEKKSSSSSSKKRKNTPEPAPAKKAKAVTPENQSAPKKSKKSKK